MADSSLAWSAVTGELSHSLLAEHLLCSSGHVWATRDGAGTDVDVAPVLRSCRIPIRKGAGESKTHRHRQQCGDYQREGWGRKKRVKGDQW